MNLVYLNGRIALSKVPITAIAEKMGLSRQSLYLKMQGKRDFKISEVNKICKILRLTDEEKQLIFFAGEGDKDVTVIDDLKGAKT